MCHNFVVLRLVIEKVMAYHSTKCDCLFSAKQKGNNILIEPQFVAMRLVDTDVILAHVIYTIITRLVFLVSLNIGSVIYSKCMNFAILYIYMIGKLHMHG